MGRGLPDIKQYYKGVGGQNRNEIMHVLSSWDKTVVFLFKIICQLISAWLKYHPLSWDMTT